MVSTMLTSMTDAQGLLNELGRLVEEIETEVKNPELQREEHYLERVAPKINDASVKYQALAAYLQENKRDHDKEYRSVQRSFVKVMQDLQQAQRNAAKRRELLCDSDFLAVSKISAQDIQVAKEEVLEANQIASEAVVVNRLFQDVGTIIHQQGQGIDQIQHKVENIRIEIGAGVDELVHARRLQKEARQKHMIFLLLALAIAAAIIIPIVISLT